MRIALLVLVVFISSVASGQVQSADRLSREDLATSPQYEWLRNGIREMKEEGLLVGYPDGLIKGHFVPGRFDYAVAIHASLAHLIKISTYLRQQVIKMRFLRLDSVEAQAIVADRNSLQNLGASYAFIGRVIKELSPELKYLGVDPNVMLGQLDKVVSDIRLFQNTRVGSAFEPFPDVPKGHWAAGAVADLRALGLITGYPGGAFRGDK